MPHHRREPIDWNAVSIQDILEIAIEDEEEAREYYRRAAELAGNPHTREVLLRLSEMEQGHADTLRRELDELEVQRDLEAGMAD